MTDRNDIDYSRAALTLRTAGRRGDSVLAHLTPGEVVVPVSVLRAVPGLETFRQQSAQRSPEHRQRPAGSQDCCKGGGEPSAVHDVTQDRQHANRRADCR